MEWGLEGCQNSLCRENRSRRLREIVFVDRIGFQGVREKVCVDRIGFREVKEKVCVDRVGSRGVQEKKFV